MTISGVVRSLLLVAIVPAFALAEKVTGNDVGDKQCSAVDADGDVHKGKCKNVCGDNEVARDATNNFGSEYKCSSVSGEPPPEAPSPHRPATGPAPAPTNVAGQLLPVADLKPVSHVAPPYCDMVDGGKALRVTVENAGRFAVSTQVFVTFSPGGPAKRATDTIPIGASRTVTVGIPRACWVPDCHFSIVVDPNDRVHEFNEENNTVRGWCVG